MAAPARGLRVGIQVVLAVIIIGLAYWLYESITEPWAVIERQEALTERTRDRMEDVRAALIRYESERDRFPLTLDSLVTYVETDSQLVAVRDSLFGPEFNPDSLIYSPRTGKPFDYAVNDTARVKIYRLQDPDSDDVIGSLEPDPTMLNAANWE